MGHEPQNEPKSQPELQSLPKPKYSVWSTVAFVVQSIWEYDRWLLGLAALQAASSALQQFVPMLMPKYVIDQVTTHGQPGTIMAIVMVSGLILFITGSINSTTSNSLMNRFVCVRLRLIACSGRKFMTTDFQNLEDPAVLDLSQKGDRACSDNAHGVEGVMHRLLSLFGGGIVLVGTSAVITTLHPLMLVAIGALLATNFLLSSRARHQDKQVNDALAKTYRKSNYILGVMRDFSFGKDLRLFGMKDFLLDRYHQEQAQLFAGGVKILRIWLRRNNALAVTSLLQEGILYAWLCWRVIAGGMSIGDFTMYAAAIRTFSGALGSFLDDISHIRLQNEVISDFRAFLDYPDTPSGSEKLPANLAEQGCSFTVENISFRYPGRQEYALKNVSIQIHAGERLAIVGLNGAGKTTFIKLLTRLYEPEEGRILLNGVDVRTYDRREYYRLFSVVFQEIQLFAFTVAENVSMKEYDKTDPDRVKTCLEKAGLGSKILTLPKGIDTSVLKVIDEGGVEFSGGENQKLALARALYKEGPVVILDEPTAALDALAEAKLYSEFDALIGKRTAIYISHRLASTRFCDRVAVFEGGQIIEMGTHDQLMAKGGRYAELFSIQATYYSEEAQTA
ncbi:MAG: ABC transporter ATP-binding protein [Limnochordaceae bacterium]|nr:ABC transporter ATP-binding protein [Limnochordaceae bacterium]